MPKKRKKAAKKTKKKAAKKTKKKAKKKKKKIEKDSILILLKTLLITICVRGVFFILLNFRLNQKLVLQLVIQL